MSEFLSLFDQSKADELESIDNVRILMPEEVHKEYNSESSQKIREKMRLVYGADEVTDRAAVFAIGSRTYAFVPQVLRYGDRWYLGNCFGNLSAMMGIQISDSAFCLLP